MSETSPISHETENTFFPFLQLILDNRIHARKEDRKYAIEGVEDIISLIREASLSGKPRALIVLGTQHDWEESREDYMERVLKRIPPIEREKGFDPEVVRDLATKIGVLPRRTPDTVIFSKNTDEYATPEGAEDEAIYNILPINFSGLPKNTYWHELIRGYAWLGNRANVLVTVNKLYIPTNSRVALINRLRLRAQGI